MGNYFDTCLSSGQMNAFSTVANAVDLNKRVVYAKSSTGKIIGRKLIALNDQCEMVGFYTYTSLENKTANRELRVLFAGFLRAFAKRCDLKLAEQGEVPKLASQDWYNDGICSWKTGKHVSLNGKMARPQEFAPHPGPAD